MGVESNCSVGPDGVDTDPKPDGFDGAGGCRDTPLDAGGLITGPPLMVGIAGVEIFMGLAPAAGGGSKTSVLPDAGVTAGAGSLTGGKLGDTDIAGLVVAGGASAAKAMDGPSNECAAEETGPVATADAGAGETAGVSAAPTITG